MKRFFLIVLMCLWASFCLAQNSFDDSGIILDLEEDEPKSRVIRFSDMIETFIEVGNYFNTNYPGNKINTNLKPDIEKFFPDLTTQQLYDRENFIRKSILIFRWSKQKIAEIKSSFLAPDTPVLTYKDEEYENPNDHPYVDVGENNVRITTDIKKVISYSGNPKEIESYEAYKERQKAKNKFLQAFPEAEKLKKIYDKVELKKLPFYGIIYEDPKTNGEGVSPWVKQKNASLHMATEKSRLDNDTSIRGIIHFTLNQDWILLAQTYQKYPEIQVKFSNLQNIKACHLFRPTPLRALFDDGDLIVYANNFAYPFLCEIINPQENALINANVIYSLCNNQKVCQTYNASLSLVLQAGMGFDTEFNNFIVQSFTHLPSTQGHDVVIKDFSVEDNPASPSGKTLRLIIETNIAPTHPDFFIQTQDNILFSRPRIAINGNRVSARLDILTPDTDIIGQPLEITFVADYTHQYRFSANVSDTSLFNINSRSLTLGLWLLAVLGGFILNFMPCVFPVLSLKLLSLTQFGAKNRVHLRQNFGLSICGIFLGFMLLAGFLSIFKILDYHLGWGMQFQNPLFIIVMIFVILLFIGQIQGIVHFHYPATNKLAQKTFSPRLEALLSGILVVVMSTPCTGPYLGTTIGFALAGTPLDIFAILLAVALGLSLPYFLLLCFPDISVFIPRPGKWMTYMRFIMNLLLIATLIWLFAILKAQSSWLSVLCIIVLSLLFYMGLALYHFSLAETAKISHRNTYLRKRMQKLLRLICYSALLAIYIISLIIGHYGFAHHQERVAKQTASDLDFTQIGNYVEQGYNVIVKIGADWCLSCGYNDMMVFDNPSSQTLLEGYKVKLINIDWTSYNPEVLNFMAEYGRRGLPFYILYNKILPEGLVLPEILSQMSFEKILRTNGYLEAK